MDKQFLLDLASAIEAESADLEGFKRRADPLNEQRYGKAPLAAQFVLNGIASALKKLGEK